MLRGGEPFDDWSVDRFVEAWRGISERIAWLGEWRGEAARRTLREMGLPTWERVPVRSFVHSGPASKVDKAARFAALLEHWAAGGGEGASSAG